MKVSVIVWKWKSCMKALLQLHTHLLSHTISHNYHIIAVFSAVLPWGGDQLIGSDTRWQQVLLIARVRAEPRTALQTLSEHKALWEKSRGLVIDRAELATWLFGDEKCSRFFSPVYWFHAWTIRVKKISGHLTFPYPLFWLTVQKFVLSQSSVS